jgi:hypothetical protein
VPEILELWVLKEFTKVREREKQRFIRTLLKGKKKKKRWTASQEYTCRDRTECRFYTLGEATLG